VAINAEITIKDEGQIESFVLTQLINRVEYVSRNAAVVAVLQLGTELELSPNLLQTAVIRIFSHDDAFFWIDEIRPGSKIVWGHIIAGAVASTLLSSTIGESIKDGWHHTRSHELISDIVPKIEERFISEFKKLIEPAKDSPDGARFSMYPVAYRREDENFIVEIRLEPRKTRPAVR
jgi:hypothetical protein